MGFFKEFKDDLSQAVNELLPDDDQNQQTNEAEEQMINTLDTENAVSDDNSDKDKIKEWIDEFVLENEANEISEEKIEEEAKSEETNQILTEEKIEKLQEDEEENMDDNVDLELLEALNSDEDLERVEVPAEEAKEELKETPKVKATSVASEDNVTVISKGTTINGSITTDGSLDVMGAITGDIDCLGKLSITGKVKGNSTATEVYVNTERLDGCIVSDGSVKIGLGTVVIGDVTATSGVIAGAIKGEIDVNGPIVIDSTAIIKGNIKAKSVQINNGAVIEGFCSLSYASVDIDNIFE